MPGSLQSVERAAAILRLLAGDSHQLALTDIAGSLGLAKGTAHGILKTLQKVGFVEQDRTSSKYRLGATLLHLASSYLDVNELRSVAINWADSLAARSGETVRIGTLMGGRVLVVHHVFRPDDTLQVLDVGTMLESHACALGKALIAFDRLARRPQSATLQAFTHRTFVTQAALAKELALVRERGWAGEYEEMTLGESGVAAPIRSHGGLVVGSIGVSGPTERLYDPHGQPRASITDLVRDAATAVSRDLDNTPW